MKLVTSHAEWQSFPRTKTATGTETSVPVSIPSVSFSVQGLSDMTPLSFTPGFEEAYDLSSVIWALKIESKWSIFLPL
jgi:hypothetical protein